MALLEVSLFGGFSARLAGKPLAFPTQKARSLFAYLLTYADRAHSRSLLAGLLWGDFPEERARNNLRYSLAVLRRLLEPPGTPRGTYLLIQGDLIQFNPMSNYRFDVREFQELLARAAEAQGKERIRLLEEASVLYRGPFMAGFYDEWCLTEQERLEEAHFEALEKLSKLYMEEGNYRRAIACCQRMLEISPLNEGVHQRLIYLYYLSGSRDLALAQYEECRRLLQEKLGVQPLPETQALYEEIRRVTGEESLSERLLRTEHLIVRYPQLAAPFVGRTRELAYLLESWAEAKEGHGRMILIDGEAGIGKTRLLHEFLRIIAGEECQILRGGCQQVSLLYQPLVEALRAYLRDRGPKELERLPPLRLAELCRLLPELEGAFPQVRPNPPLPPEEERRRLFETWNQLFRSLACDGPLLLLLDDLHLADEPTLHYLYHLAHLLPEERALVLGAYRTEEVPDDHPLSALLPKLYSQGLLARLTLERLTPEEATALIRKALRLEGGAEFIAKLQEETGGNPLFIIELLKSLIEGGALYPEAGEWRLPSPEEVEAHIPVTVRELISARLRRVRERSRRLLELVAVAARELEPEVLTKIDGAERELREIVEELKKAHLLEETEWGLRLPHELFRQVIYEQLGPARRERLHRQLGRALEATYKSEIEELAEELAHHFTQAGERRKAFDYLLKAVGRARATYAYREAISFLFQALELLEEMEGEPKELQERCFAILLERVELQGLLGERAEEAEGIEELLELAHRLGEKDKLAEAYRRRAKLHWTMGRYRKAEEDGKRALKLEQSLGNRRGEAAALLAIGLACRSRGEHERALDYFTEALRIYRRLGERLGEAQAAAELGTVYRHLGRYSQALRSVESALQAYRAAADRFQEAHILTIIGVIEENLGRYDRALEHYRRSLGIRREIGDKRGEGAVLNNLGSTHWRMGQHEKALEHLHAALAIWEELGYLRGEEATLNNLGTIFVELGRYEEGLALFERARRINQETGSKDLEVENLSRWAEALLRLGRRSEALETARRAVELLEERKVANPHEVHFRCYRLLAELGEEGAEEELRKAFEALWELAGRIEEPELREGFLKNIRVNREIVATWGRGDPEVSS